MAWNAPRMMNAQPRKWLAPPSQLVVVKWNDFLPFQFWTGKSSEGERSHVWLVCIHSQRYTIVKKEKNKEKDVLFSISMR